MKLGKIIPFALLFIAACSSPEIPYGQSLTLSREVLADKIRGGWFGQTIGCTYGGPTEFKHKGGLIPTASRFHGMTITSTILSLKIPDSTMMFTWI